MEDRQSAVSELDELKAMIERLETLEDVQVAREVYAQLKAAGGDRARAGWLKWDDIKEEIA